MVPGEIAVRWLTFEDLRSKAEAFLSRYHPSREIPVPIESIVEFELGCDIVPVPGLHSMIDADGYTTSDMRTIGVDDYEYRNYPRRYRFTLAHEVGHIVLHEYIYKQHLFGSLAEWKAFVRSFPPKDYGRLEFQAYAFAGLVLVPADALLREARSSWEKLLGREPSLADDMESGRVCLAEELTDPFDVSRQVLSRRLEKDGIPERLRSE